MSRSLFDQDTQVHRSGAYDDTIVPSLANWETNPSSLEDDLNSLRSAVSLHLDDQAGNWYDDLNTPSALDAGSQRGVNDINTDLHGIERKRFLDYVSMVGVDVPVAAGVAATGNLLFNSAPGNGETVTIDTKVYTFTAPLGAADGDVAIGGTAAICRDNLVKAITLTGVGGVDYAAATTLHQTATAAAGAGDSLDATAKKQGTAGNTIATTETLVDVLSVWGAATLTGGVGDLVILGAGDLPSNTTAAVGAVTTEGTVVSFEASFGTATDTEVAGPTTLDPKNLVKIVDAATRDPILDGSDREIMALFQSEFNVDGTTITAVTPNRVQLSFVVINAAGDNLELVDGQYIGGKTIDYAYTERFAFDDMLETQWRGHGYVDGGAANTDRQAAYDNQGVAPVDVTTHSYLDLEGAGLEWQVRDDLEAILFRIIEGSAGATSEVELGSDVDLFDNNAVSSDFANELKVDTGGTEIDIGVTGGTVETTGAADLRIVGAGELIFVDGNEDVTWARDGILLSDNAAEWIAFESAFGEVSLMNAIVQAVGAVTRCKDVATVGGAAAADIAANTLIQGPGGPGVDNISADLCDYDSLTFVDDVDIFINGALQWNGANAAANNDVYPSAVAAERQAGCFYAEFSLRYRGGASPDVITMIAWG